ncbi:tol-pal system protein YbgF [uncultured Litoreibacter sp.]|uniref:tol-pal system protein YbgF n=1 Tax=uncultured Litoreibacter sp. TaxID=1392394 RepID=UPI002623C912|nr:tol-pal system protein YbgF [uncultured Litoreibacter sp.]
MRKVLMCLSFALSVGPLAAQDQSLADIRSELGQLNASIAQLRSELAAGNTGGLTITGDVLQRIDIIEAGLARLTSKTESLENRINRVVSDGTTRVGDLEFRLCELEAGCDLGSVGQAPPLGGEAGAGNGAAPVAVAPSATPNAGGAELAVSEKADFERAQAALASGDFQRAAQEFATFNESYPGGPLAAEAYFFGGQAFAQSGDWNNAARSYLESFSGSPDAPRAPEALMRLGLALYELGQSEEACLMLKEVGVRYPGSDQVLAANSSMRNLGCQ